MPLNSLKVLKFEFIEKNILTKNGRYYGNRLAMQLHTLYYAITHESSMTVHLLTFKNMHGNNTNGYCAIQVQGTLKPNTF